MDNYKLRYRQIHMDFHTSEKITEVGNYFDAEKFADTLDRARVNSITCFARDHHGMLYYQSKKFPELIHPGLKGRKLLELQIDACHKKNIRVPIYETVQWDYRVSQDHPEWLCLNSDGSIVEFCEPKPSPVYEAGFYRTLCINSPYRDYLKANLADLFEVITPEKIDGIFLDIVNVVDCSCKYCKEGMLKKGYNPAEKQDRIRYAKEMTDKFRRDISSYIRGINTEVSIFYNASHVGPQLADSMDAFTHWELESLPSGAWGYSHFSNAIRYARTTGLDCLGQTGKFHTSWGDFHSFKNKEALEYECFRMLAYNSKCLVGDQLEPDGRISEAVYNLVGSVYAEVEKKEPWCIDAKPVVDLAVFTSEDLTKQTKSGLGGDIPLEVNGVCSMLDEMGYQFDIVDRRTDLNDYKVLILPDTILCNSSLEDKIETYVAAGGKIIATGKSGLNETETDFALKCLGVKYIGTAPYSPDFLMPNEVMGKGLPDTEHVMYDGGVQVDVTSGEILAETYIPYFNRTWEHFCSHKHTPSAHQAGYPGVVRNGNCIYFMHPLFTTYNDSHPKWYKMFMRDALEMLLPDPVIITDGPTTMISTVNIQENKNRYIIHLLHYIPVKASRTIYTIEDIIPLNHIKCSLKVPTKVKSVTMVPEMKTLEFTMEKDRVNFIIPKVEGHRMISIDLI